MPLFAHSSHCSTHTYTIPSEQVAIVQLFVQASLVSRFPSSHCSLPSGKASPHICSLVINAKVEHVVNSHGSAILDTRKTAYRSEAPVYV